MIILQKIKLNHLFTMQKSDKASGTKKNQPRKNTHKTTPPLHPSISLVSSIFLKVFWCHSTRSLIRMQNDQIIKRGMGVRFCIAHYYKYCVMRTKMGSYKMWTEFQRMFEM